MPPPPRIRLRDYHHASDYHPAKDPFRAFGALGASSPVKQPGSRRAPHRPHKTATLTAASEDLSSATSSPVRSLTEDEVPVTAVEDTPKDEDAPQPADEVVEQIEWEDSLFARDGDAIVFNLPADEGNNQVMPKMLFAQRQPSKEQDKDLTSNTNRRLKPEMLQGNGVEIVVGVDYNRTPNTPPQTMWFLPVALVCYYSLTLRNAHKRDRHHPLEVVRITLPENDPSIFALFVEWMYYGGYTPEVHQSATVAPDVSIDIQAWMLGHRLGCVLFENYAMKRLHARHSGDSASPFSTADVRYAMLESPGGSKLELLYEHLIPAWIVQPERTKGTTEDWDAFFQAWPELRWVAFDAARDAFRGGERKKELLEPLETYSCERVVETERREDNRAVDAVVPAKGRAEDEVLPAKRRAEDVDVKEEPEMRGRVTGCIQMRICWC